MEHSGSDAHNKEKKMKDDKSEKLNEDLNK